MHYKIREYRDKHKRCKYCIFCKCTGKFFDTCIVKESYTINIIAKICTMYEIPKENKESPAEGSRQGDKSKTNN